MLVHGDRHLPCVQRPHTRCYSLSLGRSLIHRASLIHTTPLTPTGALTHGVSSTQGGSHTRAASRAHVVSSACGAPFTHGVPGSTHSGTLVTTPLAHGGSFAPGGSSKHRVSLIHGGTGTHGVSLIHGVSLAHGGAFKLGGAFAHTLLLPVCVRHSTHFHTLVYTHCDTTHTGSERRCVRGATSVSASPCATPGMDETPVASEPPCASGVVTSVPECVLPGTPCVKGAPQAEETTCARDAARVCVNPHACVKHRG